MKAYYGPTDWTGEPFVFEAKRESFLIEFELLVLVMAKFGPRVHGEVDDKLLPTMCQNRR